MGKFSRQHTYREEQNAASDQKLDASTRASRDRGRERTDLLKGELRLKKGAERVKSPVKTATRVIGMKI